MPSTRSKKFIQRSSELSDPSNNLTRDSEKTSEKATRPSKNLAQDVSKPIKRKFPEIEPYFSLY